MGPRTLHRPRHGRLRPQRIPIRPAKSLRSQRQIHRLRSPGRPRGTKHRHKRRTRSGHGQTQNRSQETRPRCVAAPVGAVSDCERIATMIRDSVPGRRPVPPKRHLQRPAHEAKSSCPSTVDRPPPTFLSSVHRLLSTVFRSTWPSSAASDPAPGCRESPLPGRALPSRGSSSGQVPVGGESQVASSPSADAFSL